MHTVLSRFSDVNKFEKGFLAVLVMGAMLILTTNVIWIAGQLGLDLAPGIIDKVITAVGSGTSLGAAFATIAGITLPAWAIAGAAALGATAA